MNLKKESIVLKKKNFKGEETEVSTEDLLIYESLKRCSLFHFYLTEKDIMNLNQLNKLEYIYFDLCYFAFEKFNFNSNVTTLIFNLCENLKLDFLKRTMARKIEITELKKVKIELDISEIENALNLEELAIHNCKVKQIEKILEVAPNIKVLNLDGSTVDNEEFLLRVKEKIQVSNQKEYYLANA